MGLHEWEVGTRSGNESFRLLVTPVVAQGEVWGWHWPGPRASSPLSPWQDRAAQLQATGSDVHVEVSDNALLALQGSGGPMWACRPPGPHLVDVTALPTSPPLSWALPSSSHLHPQVPPWHGFCRQGCQMTWPSSPL